MNKFIRNNQKKILAIFSAFLMVVFILPSQVKNNRGGGDDRVVGTIGDAKVTVSDVQQAADYWRELQTLGHHDPNDPTNRQYPLVKLMLGMPAFNQINQNQSTFFLLVQEAHKDGIIISGDEMTSTLTNNIGLGDGTELTDEQKAEYAPAISNLLMVRDLLRRTSEIVKVSQPRAQLAMAREKQQLSLNVLEFSADEFLSRVPEPTTEQIQGQYDNFKNRDPDQWGVTGDVLGFGYRADRVKLQYIYLDHDDVYHAAEMSKPGNNDKERNQEWENAAFKEFKENREMYDSEPVEVAATQPSTQPSTLPNLPALASATQPSTQPSTVMTIKKIDDLAADFKLHHDIVLKLLKNDESSKLNETVMKEITSTMNSDYAAWTEAQKGTGATTRPASSQGPPYDSYEYMSALKQTIYNEHKVTPLLGQIDRFESAKELANEKPISLAGVPINQAGQKVSFAQYALSVKGIAPQFAISPWQLSAPLYGSNDNQFLFRITAIDPGHIPPLDEIRGQLIKDWKLGQAFALAEAAAKETLANAKKSGLTLAAIAAGRPGIITTEGFVPQTVREAGESAKILPLKLKPQSAMELSMQAQNLLTTPPPGPNLRPIALAELYPDAIATVIELDKAEPTWKDKSVEASAAEIGNALSGQESENLIASMCSYQSVAARLNYKPAAK